jgi:hypothetical protein
MILHYVNNLLYYVNPFPVATLFENENTHPYETNQHLSIAWNPPWPLSIIVAATIVALAR